MQFVQIINSDNLVAGGFFCDCLPKNVCYLIAFSGDPAANHTNYTNYEEERTILSFVKTLNFPHLYNTSILITI